MQNKEYEILDIKKDKVELRKNLGLLSLGVFLTGTGIVGMRYFGEMLFNNLNKENCNFSSILNGVIAVFSLITSTFGGSLVAESIPKFKANLAKVKENKKELKR